MIHFTIFLLTNFLKLILEVDKVPCYNFIINNQELQLHKDFSQPVIAKSINYLEFSVKWTDSNFWQELNYKYAEFLYNGRRYLVEVSDSFVTPQKKYYIPWEVIDVPGFSVSFFGTDTELSLETLNLRVFKRITTNIVKENVYPSGKIDGEFKNPSSSKKDNDADEVANAVLELILPIQKEETDFIIKTDGTYQFDEDLTNAIGKIIDDKVGILITSDF